MDKWTNCLLFGQIAYLTNSSFPKVMISTSRWEGKILVLPGILNVILKDLDPGLLFHVFKSISLRYMHKIDGKSDRSV